MTVTINGATGIAGVNGTAVIPAMQGSDTNTGVFYGTDIVAVSTGGTERMRINASGQAEFTAGTAALPAITATGDTNTGIFFPAADTIAFTEGGTEVMRINSSGQAEFRAGTAALPAITSTGDTNTGIFFSAADTIDFAEGGVAIGQFDSSGNFKFNSGYGSVATAYGCRAWVNFDGTTNTGGFCTIRGSGNVTSVADNGTGDYTFLLTTAMPDLNYAVVASAGSGGGTNGYVSTNFGNAPTTTNVRVSSLNAAGTQIDFAYFSIAVFR